MKTKMFVRAVAAVSASALFFSTSFAGMMSLGESLGQWARNIPPGHYTERPTTPYLGKHPGREPRTRGGMWSPAALEAAKRSVRPGRSQKPLLQVSLLPEPMQGPPPPPPSHTLAVDAAPGAPLPWEGSIGSVNSGNGDKLTSLHLFSWKGRGGMPIDFTLYHNSETNYNDELGHGWSWTYDDYINVSGSVATVHYGDGTSIPFTSTGSPPPGSPTTYTAPAGIFDTLVKNTSGTYTLTDKNQTVYQYNSAGFCTSITDRNGNAITFTLNAYNYVTKVTDPTGRHYDITLDASNNFTSVTSPDGQTWSFTLNGSDDLSTVTWPVLDSTTYTDGFTYSTGHAILTHTDKRGKVWTYTYYSDGSVNTEVDPLSHTWTYTYTSSYTEISNPLSKTVRHNYSSGTLASVVDESGYSTSQTLNGSNLPTSVVDKRGKTWGYTYDSAGNVLTKTDPLSHVWTYTYNSRNEVLTVTDPLSHVTTNTYDTNGNLLTVTDPLSHTVLTNTYGSYGLLATATNALSKTTTYGYDSDGNLTSVTDPLTHATAIAYDSMGRVTSTTDALSHVESVAYDVWGRPVTYTHPGSSTTLVAYDAEGNVVTATDELSHTTTNAYDNAGRLTSVTNARGDVESYGYDNANRRTTVTNGRSKTRTYTFTDRGEVASLTLPDSSVEQWSYDGNGDTTAYTNPLSQVIYYTYDNAGRQTLVDYPTGTDTSFSYDNANRRTSMVDSTGTTGWTYDNASRLTGLNTPQGNLTYTYDNAGQRATMVDGSLTTTYSFDDAGRMTSLQNGYSETTTFDYNDVNLTTKQTFSSGAYDEFGYDSRNRQTSVSHKNSLGTVLSSESYSYDDAGNLSSKTVNSVTTTYGYDNIDQLLSESRTGYSASYTYDANGNRATKTLGGSTDTYSYDDADKLTSITNGGSTVKSYGYDTAGRTTSVTTSAGTTNLTYDYEGRIATITYPSSATNTFTYNGLDTRVGKVDSAGTATYKRDGADVTDSVLSDGSAVYTPGVSERRSSTTKFYGTDRLGTNTVETNTSQSVTSTKTYDAFGALVSSTGSSASPFGFVGKAGYQEDSDSGLKLLGHRYYDPSTGRFVTRDPVGEGRNWYSYCNNNPLSGLDPLGLYDAAKLFSHIGTQLLNAAINSYPLVPVATGLCDLADHGWNPIAVGQDTAVGIISTVYGAVNGDEGCQGDLIGIALVALLADGVGDIGGAPEPPAKPGTPWPDKSFTTEGGGMPYPEPDPGAQGAHSRLYKETGRKVGDYTQGYVYDDDGKFLGRVDNTDHGRPDTHPSGPHWHPWRGPNGGWGGPEPLPW